MTTDESQIFDPENTPDAEKQKFARKATTLVYSYFAAVVVAVVIGSILVLNGHQTLGLWITPVVAIAVSLGVLFALRKPPTGGSPGDPQAPR